MKRKIVGVEYTMLTKSLIVDSKELWSDGNTTEICIVWNKELIKLNENIHDTMSLNFKGFMMLS